MSCSRRNNAKKRDINIVRILAQATANATRASQLIYKTICDGVQIYKFAPDWKGPVIETVRPKPIEVLFDGDDPRKDFFRDTKDGELQSTESTGIEGRTGVIGEDVVVDTGGVPEDDKQKEVPKRSKKRKKNLGPKE